MARRLLVSAIIAVCLGGPIVEAWDSWDQTAKDGNDTEANAVIAALCIGVAFALGTVVVVTRIRTLSFVIAGRAIASSALVQTPAPLFVPDPTSSPPTVLRL